MEKWQVRRVIAAGLGGFLLIGLANVVLFIVLVAAAFASFTDTSDVWDSPSTRVMLYIVIPGLVIGAGMLPALSLGLRRRWSLLAGISGFALAYGVYRSPHESYPDVLKPADAIALVMPVGVSVLAASLLSAEGRGPRSVAALYAWAVCIAVASYAGIASDMPGIAETLALSIGVVAAATLLAWISVPLAALFAPEVWAWVRDAWRGVPDESGDREGL